MENLKANLASGVIGNLATKAGQAIISFVKDSIQVGMSFDTAMSQVAATMRTTVDRIQNLSDFAKEMGRTTAFTATQAAEALNYMALAGYDAETSMSMLPNVLNLAAAGSMDLALASDMITDSQSALGLSSEETSLLVNKMAVAASTTNTSVSQLGDAILTVGGTARNLAGGTTELNTVLGILADNSTKGAEGGTHLRNILMSLSAPTDTAKKTLDNLGVSAYDANGNLRPLRDTFADLNDALSDKTTAERTSVISEIFNLTDIKDVNNLLNTTAERWDEVTAAIDDAGDAAAAMAGTQLDNLAGDVTLFQSALDGVKLALYERMSPALRSFVQLGTKGATALTSAFGEDGLTGAIGNFGEAFSNMVSRIDWSQLGSDIWNRFVDIVTNIDYSNLVKQGFTLLGAAIGGASALANGLSEAINHTIELAMIKVAMYFESKVEEAGGNVVLGVFNGILDAMKGIDRWVDNNIVMPIINGFKTGFGIHSPSTVMAALGGNIVDGLINGIKNAPTKVLTYFKNITNSAINWGRGAVIEMGYIGQNLITGLWNGISNKTTWITTKIKSFGNSVISQIKNIFGVHSPSTVMQEIGDNLTLGLAIGIEKGSSEPMKAITALSDSVLGLAINIGDSVTEPLIKAIELSPSSTADSFDVGDLSVTASSRESRLEELLNQILGKLYDVDDTIDYLNETLYDKMAKVLDNRKIEWNDRELGRFVKSYA